MIKLAMALTLAAISMTCEAEELLSTEYSRCMDRSDGVTVEILNCIADETKAQDAMLNRAYKRLGSDLDPTRKQQLVDVQRLWIKYRDANCRFYADPDGGTAAGLASNGCFLQATAERAKELEALAAGD